MPLSYEDNRPQAHPNTRSCGEAKPNPNKTQSAELLPGKPKLRVVAALENSPFVVWNVDSCLLSKRASVQCRMSSACSVARTERL